MSNEKTSTNIEGATEKVMERLTLDSTFEDLLSQARSLQSECEDFFIDNPTKSLTMRPDIQIAMNDPKTGRKEHFTLTDHAFGQICTKLEIPARYMKKCLRDKEPDLVEDSFNTWLGRYDKPLLLRAHKDHLRGVLSSRFSMFDTPDILSAISDTSSDFKVKGSYISPERLHIRLIERTRLPIEGEDLFCGIQVDSSDVGRRLLTVRLFVFKQVCTNGLVLPISDFNLFSQKHMGLTLEDFSTSFRSNLSRYPMLKEEMVRLLNEIRGEKLSAKKFNSLLEQALAKAKLSEDLTEKIVSLVEAKYTPDRFGLANSLTEIAQGFTLDRRIEIEEAAGGLLIAA